MEDRLRVAVRKLVDDCTSEDTEESRIVWMKDLQEHGCESGMVSGLIYTSDCVKFFDEYKDEIGALLATGMEECGYTSPVEMFGDKWYKDDPLALDDQNKNLLAWYACETVVNEMLANIGETD